MSDIIIFIITHSQHCTGVDTNYFSDVGSSMSKWLLCLALKHAKIQLINLAWKFANSAARCLN